MHSNPISRLAGRGPSAGGLAAGIFLALAVSGRADVLPPLSPDLPQDIPNPPAKVPEVDLFAWQMFVALNWPALKDHRGEPDTARKIGDDGVTVWESYKDSDEVFLPNGADPGPWDDGSRWDEVRHLTHIAKASPNEIRLSHVNQAVGGSLTDLNGNLVFYQKAPDELSYEYIWKNRLYNAKDQQSVRKISFPNGSIEVKAAWKVLTGADKPERFHTMPATVVGTNGVPTAALVGLVGFHIIVKTPKAPQWVWCTFEQVDNVPPKQDGVASSFFNPDSTQPANQQTPKGVPAQVTRVVQDLPGDLNRAYQAALGNTDLKYYELVGVHFPTEPLTPGALIGTPKPDVLGNTVMETYIQPISSCMACHSTATSQAGVKSDFSFMLLDAQSPNNTTK